MILGGDFVETLGDWLVWIVGDGLVGVDVTKIVGVVLELVCWFFSVVFVSDGPAQAVLVLAVGVV
jgi:hypothetical protein